MSKAEKISDAEWKVMEVVWENGSIPSSQIVKKLVPTTKWNPKTIHTLIRRLVTKEVLGIEKKRVNEYYALVSADECKKEITNTFIKKVYDGSLELLVSNFIKSKKLSNTELENLKNILDKELD